MRRRIEEELNLLRQYYAGVEHKESAGEDWFLIPNYRFPCGWRIGNRPIVEATIVFKVTVAYPNGQPYGFSAPSGINFQGTIPRNSGAAVGVPFDGSWQQLSWAPDGTWTPTGDAHQGSNLLAWARSFAQRLQEGA